VAETPFYPFSAGHLLFPLIYPCKLAKTHFQVLKRRFINFLPMLSVLSAHFSMQTCKNVLPVAETPFYPFSTDVMGYTTYLSTLTCKKALSAAETLFYPFSAGHLFFPLIYPCKLAKTYFQWLKRRFIHFLPVIC
jgi:hypothetical protein